MKVHIGVVKFVVVLVSFFNGYFGSSKDCQAVASFSSMGKLDRP